MASYIERRKFLATLGGMAAWPLAARAQQPAVAILISAARVAVWATVAQAHQSNSQRW